MGTSSSKLPLLLTEPERAALSRWIRLPSTPQAVAVRCRIILACAEGGRTNSSVAREFGVSPPVVGKWRERFREGRLAALRDRPRSGKPRSITDEQVKIVLEATVTEPPPNGSHWTKRDMAARAGTSASSVLRIWRRLGVTPEARGGSAGAEREEPWSALHLAPPETIMALAVNNDDAVEPAVRPPRPSSGNYDAVLRKELAAMLSQRDQADAAGGLLTFLRNLGTRILPGQQIHLVCHGHGTRKIEAIRRWQENHPSLHLHFAPDKEFWLRLVEHYFEPLLAQRAVPGETPLSALSRALHPWSMEVPRTPFTWFEP
ncbi:helix-turn-helix domain-containing protein [Saccharopolyspora gloriosae]|uniref:helix-turn-helix domain-containing protein n=1 Tax=Saccharopolyspora gloriosae TaxID=455344 RepID=UPI001FB5E9EF|nr:helix-turn-helix domain-containing protein [Saccharopolyspora gloriosae]